MKKPVFLIHAAILLFLALTPLLSLSQDSIIAQRIQSRFEEGTNLKKRGDFQNAISIFNECLSLSKKGNFRDMEIKCLTQLGILYWNTGNLNESINYINNAKNMASTYRILSYDPLLDAYQNIHNLYQLGKSQKSNGQLEESILSFRNAIAISKRIQSPEHELKCLRLLSSVYWEKNNLVDYFELNKEALSISTAINHGREEARCHNNIGLYYWKMDNYSAATNSCEKALNRFIKENYTEGRADCLQNLGAIWADIGDYDKSIFYMQEALEIDRILGNNADTSLDLNNIGVVYRRKAYLSENKLDFQAAIKIFDEGINLARGIADIIPKSKMEIKLYNNLGAVESDLRLFSKALEHFSISLKIAEQINDLISLGIINNNIGIVYSNLGRYEESKVYYEKAIDLAAGYKGNHILWESFYEIANSYKKQKQYDNALKNYRNSIDIIENIRTNIVSEKSKASYMGSDKRLEAYQNIIDTLILLGDTKKDKSYDNEAFNYYEKAKSRAFLDSLEVAEVNISQGIDIKLASQEKLLMKEISSLYTKILLPDIAKEERDVISAKLISLEQEAEALKREIRTTSPAYANLKYPEVIKYQEAHEILVKGGDAYFAYSLGKEQSYCFVLKKSGLKIFPLPARKTLQQQVTEYRKVISNKDSQDFSLGHQLFQELIHPGLSDEVRRIIVLPDDILYLLPFETLVSDYKRKQWLIQSYAVAYIPSFSSLRELNRRKMKGPKPQNDLMAFGDPSYGPRENGEDSFQVLVQDFYNSPVSGLSRLKHSGLEIKKIASVFKNSKTATFLREEATEEKFKSQKLDDYKIIHLATHGLIDDKNPARSSVILTLDPDPSEDGLLQMREIFNLKLNADLVSLSACQTGLGQFIRGEGIESLSRAFFYAGASSVLMSLWAVNDEATCQLMERFYYHLHAGLTFIEALQKVKLEMISSRPLSHPYYWASFILTGRADMAIYKGTFIRWILFIGLPLLGVTILLFLRRRLIKRT